MTRLQACGAEQPGRLTDSSRWATHPRTDFPRVAVPLDFVIIGAQKAASTFVQHCLAAHPQIEMPLTESPNFEDPAYGAGGMAELEEMFAAVPPGVRRGIKRPDYLGIPAVPARLARHAPTVRLIVVLRDPVARAVSAYHHYVVTGRVERTGIDKAFQRLLDGTTAAEYPHSDEILRWGRYGEHLGRYRRHFAADQMLVLLQDDLAAQPERALAETFGFLGVDSGYRPRNVKHHRNVGAQSAMHLRVQRTRFRARRKYLDDTAAGRRPALTRATWPYVATLTAIDRLVMPRLPGGLEGPSAQTVSALRDYYREDVHVAQNLVRPDLTMWA